MEPGLSSPFGLIQALMDDFVVIFLTHFGHDPVGQSSRVRKIPINPAISA